MNTLSFFGERMSEQTGETLGYGPIITFTAGFTPGNRWVASYVETLRDIKTSVVLDIKNLGKMTLLISAVVHPNNSFDFKETMEIETFVIQILDGPIIGGEGPKTNLLFHQLRVTKIVPRMVKPIDILGVRQPLDLLSAYEVWMELKDRNIYVGPLASSNYNNAIWRMR